MRPQTRWRPSLGNAWSIVFVRPPYLDVDQDSAQRDQRRVNQQCATQLFHRYFPLLWINPIIPNSAPNPMGIEAKNA